MKDRSCDPVNGEGGSAAVSELERLRDATSALGPRAGFEARVMRAVELRRRPRLAEVLAFSARRAVLVGALAAAASVALAWGSIADLREELAARAVATAGGGLP